MYNNSFGELFLNHGNICKNFCILFTAFHITTLFTKIGLQNKSLIGLCSSAFDPKWKSVKQQFVLNLQSKMWDGEVIFLSSMAIEAICYRILLFLCITTHPSLICMRSNVHWLTIDIWIWHLKRNEMKFNWHTILSTNKFIYAVSLSLNNR